MRTAFRWGRYLSFAAGVALAFNAHAQVFIPLGDAPGGGFYSQVTGISGDGSTVVGTSGLGSTEKFVWTQADGMRTLPPVLTVGVINGVSGDGSTLVGTGSSGAYRFNFTSGYQILNSIGGTNSSNTIAWAVSGDGSVVVGRSISKTGLQAFRWTEAEGMVGIGTLPGAHPMFGAIALGVSDDGNVIVGRSGSVNTGVIDPEAFRWTANKGMIGLGDLPGGAFLSSALSVSADGSTIVGYGTSSLGTEAFRWTESEGMVGLGDLAGGAFGSHASAVSGDGRWIVGEGTGVSGRRSFLWDATHGMRDLQSLLAEDYGLATALNGWQLTTALDISLDGQTIIGNGINPDGQYEGWLVRLPGAVPVPEPSTYGLAAVALLGVLVGFRGKKSRLSRSMV